jgi:peptidoglycan/LPS O-acetylase OafA/YrhL
MQTAGYLLLSIFFTQVLLLVVVDEVRRPNAAGKPSFPRSPARVDRYAIYVFHFPFTIFVADFTPFANSESPLIAIGSIVGTACGVWACSTAAAIASWYLVEKPCLARKDVLAPVRQARSW